MKPTATALAPNVVAGITSLSSLSESLTPNCSAQVVHIPEWVLIKRGESTMEAADLLIDKEGHSYRKRSSFVWQCIEKSDREMEKRCPAIVREKDGGFFFVKHVHRHQPE